MTPDYIMLVFICAFSFISFIVGYILGVPHKFDGRLIINEAADSVIVAITTKPDELPKKKTVILEIDVEK